MAQRRSWHASGSSADDASVLRDTSQAGGDGYDDRRDRQEVIDWILDHSGDDADLIVVN